MVLDPGRPSWIFLGRAWVFLEGLGCKLQLFYDFCEVENASPHREASRTVDNLWSVEVRGNVTMQCGGQGREEGSGEVGWRE